MRTEDEWPALEDPVLELLDVNGRLILFNDDWESDQEAQVLFTNLAPTSPREAAILRNQFRTLCRDNAEKKCCYGRALVEICMLP